MWGRRPGAAAGLGPGLMWAAARLAGRPAGSRRNHVRCGAALKTSRRPAQDYFAEGDGGADYRAGKDQQPASALIPVGDRLPANDETAAGIARELRWMRFWKARAPLWRSRPHHSQSGSGHTRRHLWAETYEFDSGSSCRAGESGPDVASQIRVKLTPQEQARLTSSRPVILKPTSLPVGRAYFYRHGHRQVWRGEEHLEKAIGRDPGYRAAYASLAELYIATSGRGVLTRGPGAARLQARRGRKGPQVGRHARRSAHRSRRVAQQEWTGQARSVSTAAPSTKSQLSLTHLVCPIPRWYATL